jgi:succinylglutamic semialdehyde dehydrogenase
MTTMATIQADCVAMHSAFPAWQRHAEQRVEKLKQLSALIIAQRTRISELLITEAGKNRADAEAEADLLPKKIAISLDVGLLRTPQSIQVNSEAQTIWRPRGVAAVLGPFNFPLHLFHGLIVPALAVGCTVVAKPSERCPLLGQLYAELIAQAELADVCRIIIGGTEAAQTLIAHPAIKTIAAVGGRKMGLALANTLAARPEVILALELGGVNPALLLPDADLPAACAAIADGAWRMAGQRCTATRHVHVPRSLLSEVLAHLTSFRELWMPDGTPEGKNGALINQAARDSIAHMAQQLPNGLRLIAGDPKRRFAQSTCIEPLLALVEHPAARMSEHYGEEHFGPLVIVDPYDDLNECLERLTNNPYRLAASIFTADRATFCSLAASLPYGLVNHNRPTAGARSDMPFGGLGCSGNSRPAAIAAGAIFSDECVVW